jgi:sugar lactone lactonase YvrE
MTSGDLFKPGAEENMAQVRFSALNRRAALAGLGAFVGIAAAAPALGQPRAAGPLVFLDLRGRVLVADPNTGRIVPLVEETGATGADGVAISGDGRYVYWTNMGRAGANDGSIMRVPTGGGTVETIVEPGGTHTPKQLKYDLVHNRLYWSDREGMRVMRCNPDGTGIETLLRTGDFEADQGDQSKWCVGLALHNDRGEIYWTQKGGDNAGVGTIKRMNMEFRTGETADTRSDITVLFENLPEPIDLDIDERRRRIYWTDRGDHTVNRAPLLNTREAPGARTDREILVTGAGEAIGIAIDPYAQRMYFTSLGGELSAADLDGSNRTLLASGQGTLTGVTLPVGLAPANAPYEQRL